jgi:signal transduction histidine kinase
MDILAALGMILLGAAIYLVVGLLIRIHCLNRRSAAYSHDTEKNERKLLGKIDDWETQRWQGEQALRRSQEELRNLSAHLESVREEERTRLAREIHDELGQTMTVLKMDISWLNRRLDPQRTALHKKTHSMEALIDATIRTVQRLSGEIRPGLLDDLGLAAAIEWQADEFQKRAEIACDLRLNFRETTLSRDHATAIFRIYQETLTNVIRHARATRERPSAGTGQPDDSGSQGQWPGNHCGGNPRCQGFRLDLHS